MDRLAPRPLEPDGGMPARPVPVHWEVATGPRIRNVVGVAVALVLFGVHVVYQQRRSAQVGP